MQPFAFQEVKMISAPEGYIYVIQFANGIFKVGRSRGKKRVKAYTQYCAMASTTIVRTWISPLLTCAYDEEKHLIENCADAGVLEFGREWFSGLDFDDVVDLAKLFMERATDDDIRASRARIEQTANALFDHFDSKKIEPEKAPSLEVSA